MFVVFIGKEGVGGVLYQNRPLSAPRAIAVDNNTVILQSTSATSVHQSKPSTVIVQAPPSASLPTQSSGTVQITNASTTQNQPQIIGIVTSSSGGSTSIGNIITNTNQINSTVLSRVYGTDGSTIITTAPSANPGTTTTFFPVATTGSFQTTPGMVIQQSSSHQLPLTVVPSNMVLKRPGSEPNNLSRATTVMIAVTSSTANPSDSSSKRIKLDTPSIQIVTTGGGPLIGSSTKQIVVTSSMSVAAVPASSAPPQPVVTLPSAIILTTAAPTPITVSKVQQQSEGIKIEQAADVSKSEEGSDANKSSNSNEIGQGDSK